MLHSPSILFLIRTLSANNIQSMKKVVMMQERLGDRGTAEGDHSGRAFWHCRWPSRIVLKARWTLAAFCGAATSLGKEGSLPRVLPTAYLPSSGK